MALYKCIIIIIIIIIIELKTVKVNSEKYTQVYGIWLYK